MGATVVSEQHVARVVGRNIAAERVRRGLNQGVLAERLKVSQSLLSQVEGGNKAPTLRLLIDVATVLDCTVTALFRGAESESDAYRTGYADGWRDCAEDVSAHLTWKPRPQPGHGGA
jgi:transcriptional regulator with XRE-family HTH domain